ncbi:MAG: hypothetical protein LBO63_01025 [Oscillospiraceae bacterium]|nr:hypothetical protein [Oscillospiraceae bacterium]
MFFILLLLCALSLTSCFSIGIKAEDYLSVPRLPDAYYMLQLRLDEEFADLEKLYPPSGGDNRAAIQLFDINYDGVDEALVYSSLPGDDNPLRIYLFESLPSGDYRLIAKNEFPGEAFSAVRYLNIDGVGSCEIGLALSSGNTTKHLVVLSLIDGAFHTVVEDDFTLILSDVSGTANTDMTGSGNQDIVTITQTMSDSGTTSCSIGLLSAGEDGRIARLECGMSPFESVIQARHGYLSDGQNAVFIDIRTIDGRYQTEIFTVKNDSGTNAAYSGTDNLSLVSIIPQSPEGEGLETLRAVNISTQSLAGHGLRPLVPISAPLPQESVSTYYEIDWYSYDSHGRKSLVVTTYHDTDWYFEVPPEMRSRLNVSRKVSYFGETETVFSYLDSGIIVPFLKILMLTGADNRTTAIHGERFFLLEDRSNVYTAEILDSSVISESYVTEHFHKITREWFS